MAETTKIDISKPKKVSILITYDGIIRDPNMFILDYVMDNYDKYKDYLNLEPFRYIPKETRYLLMLSRKEKHLFKWLLKKNFNYEKTYDNIYHKFKDMYTKLPSLNIAKAVPKLSYVFTVDNIYLWSEKYDRRKEFEIVAEYSTNTKKNVIYVTGPYQSVVNQIDNLGFIFDTDLDRLIPIMKSYENCVFCIARLGYNYENYVYKPSKRVIKSIDDLLSGTVNELKYGVGKATNVGDFNTMDINIPKYLG